MDQDNAEMDLIKQKLLQTRDDIRETNLDCLSIKNQCEYLMVETTK